MWRVGGGKGAERERERMRERDAEVGMDGGRERWIYSGLFFLGKRAALVLGRAAGQGHRQDKPGG